MVGGRAVQVTLFTLFVTLSCSPGTSLRDAELPHLEDRSALCRIFRGQSEPLVVEWPALDRAKLEAAAKSGALAVRYADCRLEVLAGCSSKAAYAWTGVTTKRERETIHTKDELYASVPLGAAGLEGKLENNGSLEADLTVVGRFESTRATLREDELAGDCSGATHWVRGFTVGAFKFYANRGLAAGAGAKALGAEVGAQTKSERELLTEDGDESRCSAPSSNGPPEGCGAVARLELVALEEGKLCPPRTAWNGKECAYAGVPCPRGTLPNFGMCGALGLSFPLGPTCTDRGTCETDCQRGAADACTESALLMLKRAPADQRPAMLRFQQACTSGEPRACAVFGIALETGDGVPKDPQAAAKVLEQGCTLGAPTACHALAFMLFKGTGVAPDIPRARQLINRACAAGNAFSCIMVAERAWDEKRYADASSYLERACTAGVVSACGERGRLERELGDVAASLVDYRRACDGGEPRGCAELADAFSTGRGTALDLGQALDLGRRACTAGTALGCYVAGVAYADGRGTQPNNERARTALRRACDGQVRDACARLSALR